MIFWVFLSLEANNIFVDLLVLYVVITKVSQVMFQK